MKGMLHIVNKSPSERPALASCLRLAAAGDSILLIEDGVYAALRKSTFNQPIIARSNELNLYVLVPDLQIRGLQQEPLVEGIELVDYAGFVDLVAGHTVNQSWL